MIEQIITIITHFIIQTISSLGYVGIGVLMAIQTTGIPMPSEVIIPFAGYLILSGRFSLLGIAVVGGLGSALGASVAYLIGFKGGRALVEKYGRWILISQNDLMVTGKFFSRFGAVSAFVGQLLPVVRSFIGFPAGMAKMKYLKFVVYTFVGSFFWSLILAFVGMKLGENWVMLREKLKGFDVAIVVLIVAGVAWWVYRHVKNSRKSENQKIGK